VINDFSDQVDAVDIDTITMILDPTSLVQAIGKIVPVKMLSILNSTTVIVPVHYCIPLDA
jgi:dTDP-4-amino-4,6-dideoxygalactose transaminase